MQQTENEIARWESEYHQALETTVAMMPKTLTQLQT
jgi:hypothetical protein